MQIKTKLDHKLNHKKHIQMSEITLRWTKNDKCDACN